MMSYEKYFEVLGIEKTATFREMRTAYKKQAKQYHPDKNVGNEQAAAENFKKINEAHAELSEYYDKYGNQGQQAQQSNSSNHNHRSPPPPPKKAEYKYVSDLENVIYDGSKGDVFEACIQLTKLNVRIPESLIIAAMDSFTGTETASAVMNAVVATGSTISQKVLLFPLENNHTWKDDFLEPVLAAIQKTNGELTADNALKQAIDSKNGKYVIAITNALVNRKQPISEDLIIAAMKQFTGTETASAVMNAVVQSGGEVSQKVLISLLDSKHVWKNNLYIPILEAMSNSNVTLTSDEKENIEKKLQESRLKLDPVKGLLESMLQANKNNNRAQTKPNNSVGLNSQARLVEQFSGVFSNERQPGEEPTENSQQPAWKSNASASVSLR